MGSCLIGWICIGPKEISDDRKDMACSRALKVANLITDWVENEEDMPDDLGHLADIGIDEDYQIEEFVGFDIDQIRAFVEEFISFWTYPYHNDAIWRDYGNKQIVSTGNSTWGDEPDSYSYNIIKKAIIFDILEPLGIE